MLVQNAASPVSLPEYQDRLKGTGESEKGKHPRETDKGTKECKETWVRPPAGTTFQTNNYGPWVGSDPLGATHVSE